MAKEFLGRGWKFPIGVDGKGRIAVSSHEEDIREAIHIILDTAKGERLMRPEFGCGIHEYVFSPINTMTLRMIENSVFEALVMWEPRIEVLEVKAERNESSEGALTVNIDYRVRVSNTRFNMVYPFYIKEG